MAAFPLALARTALAKKKKKTHKFFCSQDQHGARPTGQPHPPCLRPSPGAGEQGVLPQPLEPPCRAVWGSVGLTLRPLSSKAQTGPRREIFRLGMAVWPELGPVSVLWVVDICCLVFGGLWTSLLTVPWLPLPCMTSDSKEQSAHVGPPGAFKTHTRETATNGR